MKKIVQCMAIVIALTLYSIADAITPNIPTPFETLSLDNKVLLLQKGDTKAFCPQSGMSLAKFYKTNHLAHVDGKIEQYCSLHCLVTRMQESHMPLSHIQVVDNTTLKFVDVLIAWYVVGSFKSGTMSRVSKYAFGKKEDAKRFAKQFGGEVMSFHDTLDIVNNNLPKESARIAQKESNMAKKGQLLYENLCIPFEEHFESVATAKAYLLSQEKCAKLSHKQLHAIALYLKLAQTQTDIKSDKKKEN